VGGGIGARVGRDRTVGNAEDEGKDGSRHAWLNAPSPLWDLGTLAPP
jgi:hypothetical protein